MQLFPFGHATHPQWQMAAGLVLAFSFAAFADTAPAATATPAPAKVEEKKAEPAKAEVKEEKKDGTIGPWEGSNMIVQEYRRQGRPDCLRARSSHGP